MVLRIDPWGTPQQDFDTGQKKVKNLWTILEIRKLVLQSQRWSQEYFTRKGWYCSIFFLK